MFTLFSSLSLRWYYWYFENHNRQQCPENRAGESSTNENQPNFWWPAATSKWGERSSKKDCHNWWVKMRAFWNWPVTFGGCTYSIFLSSKRPFLPSSAPPVFYMVFWTVKAGNSLRSSYTRRGSSVWPGLNHSFGVLNLYLRLQMGRSENFRRNCSTALT